jgi:putative transposase
MEELCITGSHSRPSVSNDNPYSESPFQTMKYCTQWPSKGFKDLQTVRDWVSRFVGWYNDDHCHSRIGFVTPSQRHRGEYKDLLQKRTAVYEQAKERNPLRWSGGAMNALVQYELNIRQGCRAFGVSVTCYPL